MNNGNLRQNAHERNPNPQSCSEAFPPDVLAALNQLRSDLAQHIREVIQEEIAQTQEPDPLLDVGAVARRLSVSKRTVETIIAEGKLRPIWVRGSRRFTPEAVEAYIREQARKTRR